MAKDIGRFDRNTGEILQPEPPFVKAYAEHITSVKGVTKMQTSVLWFLLSRMNFDNTVCISIRVRNKFIDEMKTSSSSFSNCVTALAKAGFIDIEGHGQYFINPDYFTKSDWTKTKKLVAKWTFSDSGVEFQKDIIDDDGTVLIEAEDPPAKKPKAIAVKSKPSTIVIPDFIDRGLWDDFLVLRKKLKAPNNERSLNSLLKKLAKFHDDGHDINAIIQESYDNGWKSVFEPKKIKGNKGSLMSKNTRNAQEFIDRKRMN